MKSLILYTSIALIIASGALAFYEFWQLTQVHHDKSKVVYSQVLVLMVLGLWGIIYSSRLKKETQDTVK